MILVDTSIWIDHLRRGNARLKRLLLDDEVLCHDFVIGELACGSLKDRERILEMIATLPRAVHADHQEVMRLVDDRTLWGQGVGWVDQHLIASALLTRAKIWTLDRRLARVTDVLELEA